MLLQGYLPSQGTRSLKDEACPSEFQMEPFVAGKDLEDMTFFDSAMDQLVWFHNLHVQIDLLLSKLPAEKVDLSGNVLQFVSGTENADMDHATTLVKLAKELLSLSSKVMLSNNKPLQVQMGLHTGECISGVVGSHALKYSIFGEAVTVANELENLSAPGLLRISADSKRLIHGSDRWVDGGSTTVPSMGWRKIDTFLLGDAADRLSAADLREAHAACAQGSSSMGALLTFTDQRLESPYLRMHESSLKKLDAAVASSFLALTLLAVTGLALQNRIRGPVWFHQGTSGQEEEALMPLQLALGTILAWLTALGVFVLMPANQSSLLREPVCMLLRAALSVHRVQSIYLALPGCLHSLAPGLLPAAAACCSRGFSKEYSAIAHALPVLLLSFLLLVRLQQSVIAAIVCLLSEGLQIYWNSWQDSSPPQSLRHHVMVYAAITCLLPTVLLYTMERRSRYKYLATVR